MERARKIDLGLFYAVLAAVAALLLVRLAAFGIWDPWELTVADNARRFLAGEGTDTVRAPLGDWLVAQGFALFGIKEWAGRLPMAVVGIATVALAYGIAARFVSRRAGVYAAVVCGSTPLFLLNARQMLGDAPTFLAQGLIMLCAASAVFLPTTKPDADARAQSQATYRWLGALVGAVLLGIQTRGALLGVVPPLLAVALAARLDRTQRTAAEDPRRAYTALIVACIAIVVALAVGQAIVADAAEYSRWIGGRARGPVPPTFYKAVEKLFHSFAPWSALLPIALGRLLWPGSAERNGTEPQHPAQGIRLALLLWAALGYAASMLYTARYGPATFMPVVALAVAVAILMSDVERTAKPWFAAGATAALFAGLLLRDFTKYPAGPVEGIAADDLVVPAEFNPSTAWKALLGAFAVLAFLSIGTPARIAKLDLALPYRFVRDQWKRSWQFKVWLAVGGLGVIAALSAGIVAWAVPDVLGVTSIAITALRIIALLPVATVIGFAGAQLVMFGVSRFGPWRFAPLLAAGLAVGAYTAQGFLPALSEHFSPRGLYHVYKSLGSGEPLAEYRVGARAAAYYAGSDTREFKDQAALLDYLASEGRRWVAFPAGELAELNRAFRRRTRRHLFVVDASNARVLLATNEPIAGRSNESFIAKNVLTEPPRMQYTVNARWEDKVELLGYNLELPRGSRDRAIGPGQTMVVHWVYRVLKPLGGSWKIFVHVDGQGLRINGDHEPLGEKYPIRLWEEGDIVVDRQELVVPANFRAGSYGLYVGFFSGNRRMEITSGPEEGGNTDRAIAGTIQVR